MTTTNRTITTLLAVIAVLLGLNLIVKASPAAVGQAEGPCQAVPVSVAVTDLGGSTTLCIVRLWSDGMVDRKIIRYESVNACDVNLDCNVITTIPGTCTADSTRDGQVDSADFLQLLAEFGPCE